MVVTADDAGTYVQIARKLRWHRPQYPHQESARPVRELRDGTTVFTDTDAPTLVRFIEGDEVDVPSLLRQGAIARQPESVAAETPRQRVRATMPHAQGE